VTKGVGGEGYMLGEVIGSEEKTKGGRISRAVEMDVKVTRDDKVRGGEYGEVVEKRGEVREEIGNR